MARAPAAVKAVASGTQLRLYRGPNPSFSPLLKKTPWAPNQRAVSGYLRALISESARARLG